MSVHQAIQTAIPGGLMGSPAQCEWTLKKISKALQKVVQRRLQFYADENCHTIFNNFGIAENQARFDFFMYSLLARRFQKFIDEMTLNADKLPDETPAYIKKYYMTSLRFSDYELVNNGMYTKQGIYDLRYQLKKWIRKGGGKNVEYNMGVFNSQFTYGLVPFPIFSQCFYQVPVGQYLQGKNTGNTLIG